MSDKPPVVSFEANNETRVLPSEVGEVRFRIKPMYDRVGFIDSVAQMTCVTCDLSVGCRLSWLVSDRPRVVDELGTWRASLRELAHDLSKGGCPHIEGVSDDVEASNRMRVDHHDDVWVSY